IQSSAATVVMVQALALEGAVNGIGIAIPIIVGANVGTCITAMLASLQASRSARKAAIAHLVFNLVLVVISMALYRFYVAYIPRTAVSLPHQIANAHVAIKVVGVLLVLPFTRQFAGLIDRLVPGEDKLNAAPEYLDHADLGDAGKALDNVAFEIRRMFSMCMEMFSDAVDVFFEGNELEGELVKKREGLIDDLYDSIAGYVLDLSKKGLPSGRSARPAYLMHLMSDVERIGDHAENIVEISEAFGKESVSLSDAAESDLRALTKMVMDMGLLVERLFEVASPEIAEEAGVLREDIYDKARSMIEDHEKRLTEGECTVIAGIVFVDLITNLKRVSNHLKSAASNLGSRSIPSDSSEN
ncbi:hypothetical protein BVX94_01060, partial [bacterium B17]